MEVRRQSRDTCNDYVVDLRKLASCPISLGSVPFNAEVALEREKVSVASEKEGF